jgi:hypothetical protein
MQYHEVKDTACITQTGITKSKCLTTLELTAEQV